MSSAADKLAELLQLSHDLGREDRGLAILGEGNASRRLDADTFLVKASGTNLGTLKPEQLVACRFDVLLPLLETPNLSDIEVEKTLLAARVNPAQGKPSVEAVFHAWLLTMPGIDVIGHTHPIAVNGLLCAGDAVARDYAESRRFPDEIVCCGAKSVLVPYLDPGTPLAVGIRQRMEGFFREEGRVPKIVLLQNHGLIACGSDSGAVLAATLMAEKAARIYADAALLGTVSALSPAQVARIDTRPDEHYRQRMLMVQREGQSI